MLDMDDSPVSIGQRLYYLAEQGNEKELRALLVQASSDDLSFIHINVMIISFFLHYFIQTIIKIIIVTMQSGETALMIAAEKGHTEVVEALLEYNVDINMRDHVRSFNNNPRLLISLTIFCKTIYSLNVQHLCWLQ